DNKIKKLESNLRNDNNINVLAETKTRLEEEIFVHYSALINDGNGNITYSGETLLESELNPLFKDIVVNADNLLKQYYKDTRLSVLLNKEQFTLNNLVSVYNLIKDKKIIPDESRKKSLSDGIVSLQKKKEIIENSEHSKELKSKIQVLDNLIDSEQNFVENYETYAKHKENMKEFEESHGNFNNEFFISIAKNDMLENKLKGYTFMTTLHNHAKQYDHIENSAKSTLEEFVKQSGYDVSIEDIANPAKTRIPWGFGLILGILLPIIRNLAVRKYIAGKESNGVHYCITGCAGGFNAGLGVLLLDGLHPLVFPARMLTPLFFQPLFKAMKVDMCEEIRKFD
ncbi:MAG: hypothetical protein L6408_02930, partial [Nanoarchaeota archaeon]|nr:hypothetical protein [Nanoarchaeota archaeon]